MFRLAIGLVVGGGALGYFGFQEYQVGAGSSSAAVHVELRALETNETPDNHLQIGEHWAIYPAWVGWGDADSDRLDHIYYPIVSDQHPYNLAWDELIERYADVEIPESEYPQLTGLGVLVKTSRYAREGEVPEEWQHVPSVSGLLIQDISDLRSGEEQLLMERFPGLSLDNVLILEEGREPKSPMVAMGMMLLGGLLGVGGAVTFARAAE